MIDLHIHSTFSDGSYTPTQLVQEAKKRGLRAIALTDHDTVDGVHEFFKAGKSIGVSVMSGIELAADYDYGELHILGYGLDMNNEVLLDHLQWIRGGRQARNAEMIRKLNAMGINISLQEIEIKAASGVAGRPHIAEVLIEKGYFKTRKEAFGELLGNGRPAYAPRRRLPPVGCLDLIRKAGGVPVIAHPYLIGLENHELRELVGELTEYGLLGLEVYHRTSNPDQEKMLAKLAEDFGLIKTGGSDFHGAFLPQIEMGKGDGQLHVDEALFETLKDTIRMVQKGAL